mmetsp:Transcript_68131/g.221855  ORF Transcript_68131/g.221855 Transcript_68131/m.221855 type:complete len:213 (-) Transcript_68131:1081-1719(-)
MDHVASRPRRGIEDVRWWSSVETALRAVLAASIEVWCGGPILHGLFNAHLPCCSSIRAAIRHFACVETHVAVALQQSFSGPTLEGHPAVRCGPLRRGRRSPPGGLAVVGRNPRRGSFGGRATNKQGPNREVTPQEDFLLQVIHLINQLYPATGADVVFCTAPCNMSTAQALQQVLSHGASHALHAPSSSGACHRRSGGSQQTVSAQIQFHCG